MMAITSAAVLPSQPIAILRQVQDVSFDGGFVNQFETQNGISVNEKGIVKNAGSANPISEVTGTSSWTAPDGTPIEIKYIANENGAQFSGASVPKIPPAIQRALEWIQAHPYVEPAQKKF